MESWADIVEYGDDNLDDIPIPWLDDDSNSDNTDIGENEPLLNDAILENSIPVFKDGRSWAQVTAGNFSLCPNPAQEDPSYGDSSKTDKDGAEPASLPSAFALSPVDREDPAAVRAGDPIGIRAVQSILMSATQMNLSHFHTAGMNTADAASSVMPSAAEAMDSVYTKRNTSMIFEMSASDAEAGAEADVRGIRRQIVGANFGSFVITIGSSFTLLPDRENIWYEVLGVPMHSTVLRFYIDYKKMQNHGLTLKMLAQEAFGDDCSWRTSPDFMGMIDVDTSGMHMSPWLSRMEQCVCGTPNILSCDMLLARGSFSSCGDSSKRGKGPARGWGKGPAQSSSSAASAPVLRNRKVITRGTDVYAVSRIPKVDKRTIVSNNVKEVEMMFGIEAAAGMLSKLIGPRIVSDFMTRTGTVLPFHKRDEIRSKGLLTCMGFERPKDDIRAAVISKSETRNTKNVHPCDGAWGKGTYEAIMTGVDPFMGFDVVT